MFCCVVMYAEKGVVRIYLPSKPCALKRSAPLLFHRHVLVGEVAMQSPNGREDTKTVSLVFSPPALIQIFGHSSALSGGDLRKCEFGENHNA